MLFRSAEDDPDQMLIPKLIEKIVAPLIIGTFGSLVGCFLLISLNVSLAS